ncbi:Uncharacterised protein [Dermatophilus congolensis]|uniref:Uncharacterized protein n=1 Tax=Dermatophilus congolensis TaxID=1863 RepID=A0AA46BLX4_9MICO|nr:Uncharacterised protein [Dermatophilus congolensis]
MLWWTRMDQACEGALVLPVWQNKGTLMFGCLFVEAMVEVPRS